MRELGFEERAAWWGIYALFCVGSFSTGMLLGVIAKMIVKAWS